MITKIKINKFRTSLFKLRPPFKELNITKQGDTKIICETSILQHCHGMKIKNVAVFSLTY